MKKVFLITFLLIVCPCVFAKGYEMKLPVEGNSIANDALQFNVMTEIYKYLSLKNPSCYDYSIFDTQIIQYPYEVKKKDGVYKKGYWKELWTIDVCKHKVQVPVSYSIKKSGTAFKIENKFYTQ